MLAKNMSRLFLLGTLITADQNRYYVDSNFSVKFRFPRAVRLRWRATRKEFSNQERSRSSRPRPTPAEGTHRTASTKFLAACKREHHVHGGLHFHRLAVQVVGLIAPLLHGFERGRGQHWVSADHVQVLNGTVLADHRLQDDCALNARLTSQRRIRRLHLVNQQALRYALRHSHTRRGGCLG